MEKPGLGRRRLLELGAGGIAAAALAAFSTDHATGESTVELQTGSFVSRFHPAATTEWTLATPVSSSGAVPESLPVAVFLHGVGSDNRMVFDALHAHEELARHLRRGGAPFAIAAVDGGNTWWHRRADGTDTQSMLVEEFLPMLGGLGLDAGRLAVFGLSMGGFGALLLASQRRVDGIRAVAAMSPAVWSQYDAGRQDNFDSAADFAANDVFALRAELELLPKRIDCGTGDNLLYSVRDYVKDLPGGSEGGFPDGGHDEEYWRTILPDVLTFLGKHLS